MGVGGNFWDLLKPYAHNEGFDFLRNKRVAVDLSFWIVQHETAIKNKARNPHLRLTFFRTINLFSKLGVFPVFVVDGVPSPLKARARMERFFRNSGIDFSSLPKVDEGVSVERNGAFTKCVRECVELLEILGMPILKARGEAEALCAQLNNEGHVDACITADSDAFLFGAKCVIKSLQPNFKIELLSMSFHLPSMHGASHFMQEPFECYQMSDIEVGLGLKREHLIALSLLVGNDFDLGGVSGIGIDSALRFVRMFPADDILHRLHEVGNGDLSSSKIYGESFSACNIPSSGDITPKKKSPHCSNCGHPGSKRAHLKVACEYCSASCNESCMEKPLGFKCECSSCDMDRKSKEQEKQRTWLHNVCNKIAMEHNFPSDEIIEMYLSQNNGHFSDNQCPSLSWEKPKMETLIDFLSYHQHWSPAYIRQRMLPMLSTIFLREMASNPTEGLSLHGQFEFHCVQRVKIRCGHPLYLVNWKKIGAGSNASSTTQSEQSDAHDEDLLGPSESIGSLDEPDVPDILVDEGGWCMLTEENMDLVQAAFPEEVARFLEEKEMKESSSRRRKSSSKSECDQENPVTPKSSGVQLSITEFYRSTKASAVHTKHIVDLTKSPEDESEGSSKGKRKVSTPNISKSVRRRLLFE